MFNKKIGSLWLQKTKDGTDRQYMAGKIETIFGDIKIVVFKNEKKESNKHPDYNILLSEPQKVKDGVEQKNF